MRVADYIFKTLADKGLEHVFLVTGGGAMHLNDAVKKEPRIKYTCCHHEQACAIAAEGFYRASKKLPVVSVTTGPGGTNAMTGVIGQWLDSIPCLYISGQVKFSTTIDACPELNLRQLGDQEINIIDIVRPVTKYAVSLTAPEQIFAELGKAISIATSGRPGPVWIDIPLNIQGAPLPASPCKTEQGDYATSECPPQSIETLGALIAASRRPIIIAGHGIELSNAEDAFLHLLESKRIPVVTTFNGMNVIPSNHPLYFGRIGSVGQRKGNFVLQNADLIISIGSRNNIRQISYNWENFAVKSKKVIVDIDPKELKKPTVVPDLAICSDVGRFIEKWNADGLTYESQEWTKWCEGIRRKYPAHTAEQESLTVGVNPYHLTYELTRLCPDKTTIVTGNGMACVAMFQTGISKRGNHIFWNSGCAAMGYDIPAAEGAAVATSGLTLCLAGDGSAMMNLQELETIAFNHLPVKVFILENGGYMSIRQTQRNLFSADFIGCGPTSGVGFPDFSKVAAAFDLPCTEISNHQQIEPTLQKVFATNDPEVIVVHIPPEIEFSPKLSARRLPDGSMVSPSLEDMFPFLDRKEMEENVCRI